MDRLGGISNKPPFEPVLTRVLSGIEPQLSGLSKYQGKPSPTRRTCVAITHRLARSRRTEKSPPSVIFADASMSKGMEPAQGSRGVYENRLTAYVFDVG